MPWVPPPPPPPGWRPEWPPYVSPLEPFMSRQNNRTISSSKLINRSFLQPQEQWTDQELPQDTIKRALDHIGGLVRNSFTLTDGNLIVGAIDAIEVDARNIWELLENDQTGLERCIPDVRNDHTREMQTFNFLITELIMIIEDAQDNNFPSIWQTINAIEQVVLDMMDGIRRFDYNLPHTQNTESPESQERLASPSASQNQATASASSSRYVVDGASYPSPISQEELDRDEEKREARKSTRQYTRSPTRSQSRKRYKLPLSPLYTGENDPFSREFLRLRLSPEYNSKSRKQRRAEQRQQEAAAQLLPPPPAVVSIQPAPALSRPGSQHRLMTPLLPPPPTVVPIQPAPASSRPGSQHRQLRTPSSQSLQPSPPPL